jgi:DNA-binding MarR family transcriptional regulator
MDQKTLSFKNVMSIIRIYTKLQDQFETSLQKRRVSLNQFHTLTIIKHNKPVDIRNLISKVGISPKTTATTLKQLARKNFIHVYKPIKPEESPHQLYFSLTPRGEKLQDILMKQYLEIIKDLFGEFDSEELEDLGFYLEKALGEAQPITQVFRRRF